MLTVLIMPIAEVDIDEPYQWWRDNRSVEQANRWYCEIFQAMLGLSTSAPKRPQSPEAAKLGVDLRELYFGIGTHPTHRVVFIIEERTAKILRVRHLSRGRIEATDL